MLKVCEPVSQKVCANVEVAVPRYFALIAIITITITITITTIIIISKRKSSQIIAQASLLPNRCCRLCTRHRRCCSCRRCRWGSWCWS